MITVRRSYLPLKNNAGDEIPGVDAVGVVEELGPGADGAFAPGTRVVSLTWDAQGQGGTWQRYLTVPVTELVAVPDGLSDILASQYRVNPVTVYGFIDVARQAGLTAGGWIYNDAAASVLGRMLIRMAKAEGYRTVNIVRRAAHVAELEALGGDVVIDSSAVADIPAAVRRATGGRGVDFAFTAVSGPAAAVAGASTVDNGIVIVYSGLSGQPPHLLSEDQARGVTFGERFFVFTWIPTLGERRTAVEADVLRLMADGTLAGEENGIVVPLARGQDAVDAVFVPNRGSKWFLSC